MLHLEVFLPVGSRVSGRRLHRLIVKPDTERISARVWSEVLCNFMNTLMHPAHSDLGRAAIAYSVI